jgi:hypothetical protein
MIRRNTRKSYTYLILALCSFLFEEWIVLNRMSISEMLFPDDTVMKKWRYLCAGPTTDYGTEWV